MKSLLRINPALEPEARLLYTFLKHEFTIQSRARGEEQVLKEAYEEIGKWKATPEAQMVAAILDDVVNDSWSVSGISN